MATTVDPNTGLGSYGSSSSTPNPATTNPAAGTPAAPVGPTNTTTPTPTILGPPGSTSTIGTTPPPASSNGPPNTQNSGENFPLTLDPSIASQILPGGSQLPVNVGQRPQQLDEKTLVNEIASHLGIKAAKGQSLESTVVTTLARKYGVQIIRTSTGTGNKQGTVGGLRHDIASWFNDAVHDQGRAGRVAVGQPGVSVSGAERQPQDNTGRGAVPVESKAALDQMFQAVAKKMGGSGAAPLNEIAQREGNLPTTTAGTPTTGGGPTTAGQAYQTFAANAITVNKSTGVATLTSQGKAWAQDFVNAGLLTTSQTNDVQAVTGAYTHVITQAVQTQQSTTQVLAAGAAQATTVGTPHDEWASYVQGVATEFGVALSPQQVNDIATQYYQQALNVGVTSPQNGPSTQADAIKNSVVALYDPNNPNDPAGVADQMFTGIQQAALAYGIPIGKDQIGGYVKTYLQGATVESMYVAKQSAIDAATKMFQQQAAGAYPTIAPQIQAGMTVHDIVQPYNSITAQYTGVDPNSIKTDPTDKYSAFLQGGRTRRPALRSCRPWTSGRRR